MKAKETDDSIPVLIASLLALIGAVLLSLFLGCNPQPTPEPTPTPTPNVAERTYWSPLVAVAAAEASMQGDSTPAPLPPAPDPDDDSGTKPGGPFDFIRDAKALVKKGNALADRGKSILDKAEAEGKVTIDVRLPGGPQETKESTAEESEQSCPDGSCSTQGPIRRFFRRRR